MKSWVCCGCCGFVVGTESEHHAEIGNFHIFLHGFIRSLVMSDLSIPCEKAHFSHISTWYHYQIFLDHFRSF